MSEVDAILSLIERISQLSGTAALIGILVAFNRKVVVWGWLYEEERKQRIVYETILRENSAKIEAKLAEYEKSRGLAA